MAVAQKRDAFIHLTVTRLRSPRRGTMVRFMDEVGIDGGLV
jgi:hypothetical protein